MVLVGLLAGGQVGEAVVAAGRGAFAAIRQLPSAPSSANRDLIGVAARFEDRVEESNPLVAEVMPALRLVGWNTMGIGSHDVVPGDEDWLFRRPDLEAVLAPDPLSAAASRRAARWGRRDHDPMPAIEAWNRALAARGITLVVAPTPIKSELEVGRFASGAASRRVAGFVTFAEALDRAGIRWFDAGECLLGAPPPNGSWFLRHDTHWKPEAVHEVAARLAAQLKEVHPGLADQQRRFEVVERRVSGEGDLLRLLRLPDQSVGVAETVQVAALRDPTSAVGRGGRVLVLGDSFTGVFSRPELGWGRGAGLAEQLARELGGRVDVVTVNAGGARGSRERLVAELAADPTRLDGVSVVVWQFAARELALGSWPILPLPPG